MKLRGTYIKWGVLLLVVGIVNALFVLIIVRAVRKDDTSTGEEGDEVTEYTVKTVVDEQGEEISFEYMEFTLGEGGVFEQEEEIAVVGEETLYGRDLNLKIWINHIGRVENQWEIGQDDIDRYLDELILESKLLQIGRKEGILELSDVSFNAQVKNYKERNELIDTVKDYIEQEGLEKVSFELVSMWFYNMTPPEMGVEAAKPIVYEKITNMHTRVVKGELSMEEAGEEIRSDEEQAGIDEAYKVNSYIKVEDESVKSPHFTPKVVERAVSLKEGEVSEIILETSSFSDEIVDVEAYYYFVKNIGYSGGSADIEIWVSEHFNGEVKILL